MAAAKGSKVPRIQKKKAKKGSRVPRIQKKKQSGGKKRKTKAKR